MNAYRSVESRLSSSLTSELRRARFRALWVAFSLLSLATGLLFANDYAHKKELASYFSNILREEILVGGLRDATFQAQRMVMNDGPFHRITFTNENDETVIDKTRDPTYDKPEPFLSQSIVEEIRYNTDGTGQYFGKLVFRYYLNNLFLESLLIFLVGTLISLIYTSQQRRKLVRKFNAAVVQQKNTATARMINGIAHDLRAPLGMLTIYLQEERNETNEDYLAATQGLTRIQAMIDSLRSNNAEEIVNQKITRIDLDYIHGFLTTLARQQGKAISFKGSSRSPLQVDLPKLERLVQNLCMNALEAASSRVRVEWYERGSDLLLRVVDDGLGVPDSFLPQLFHSGASHGKVGGTGLGLAFCKRVAEGHGGSLKYRRQDAETVFEAVLPVLVSQEERKLPEQGISRHYRRLVSEPFSVCVHMPQSSDVGRRLEGALERAIPSLSIVRDLGSEPSVDLVVVSELTDTDDLPLGTHVVFHKACAGGIEATTKKVEQRFHIWKNILRDKMVNSYQTARGTS